MAGMLGVILRYMIVLLFSSSQFWQATLIVNVLGCFIFGVVVSVADYFEISELLKACLLVGLCGALTTFSTFAYDLIRLLSNQEFNMAVMYFIGSNVLSIVGFGLGYVVPMMFK